MDDGSDDDGSWWLCPRSKYLPPPLHTPEDVEATSSDYEQRDNVRIRARGVIISAISTWVRRPWEDCNSIPVVRDGKLVNKLSDLSLGNAFAPSLPFPDQVIDAASAPSATDLKLERKATENLISSLETVRASAKELSVDKWWSLGSTWDHKDGPPDHVVDIIHALGLGKSFNASAHGLLFNARRQLRLIDFQLNEIGSVRGRPRDVAAHLVAARYGRLYAIVTGKRPTYGESPDGMAGEFTPALRDLFDALGWRGKTLRGPAESARLAVTEELIRSAEPSKLNTAGGILNAFSAGLHND